MFRSESPLSAQEELVVTGAVDAGFTVHSELKTVPQLKPIHRAQVISYLKAMGLKVGLIMNFNAELFKAGIKRVVHTPRPLSTGSPGEPLKP
jgi:GxxExxY protein